MEQVLEVASGANAQCASRRGTYCDESYGGDTKPELPNPRTMRRWHVKLDLMSMMFRRWQYEQGHFDQSFVCICADGSLQWGYDFLITKIFVATISLPEEDCGGPLAYVDVDEHLLPLATCGHGRSKLEHKLPKLIRQIKLEVGTSSLPGFRGRVRSCYSDQAAEKGLWGSPNLIETTRDRPSGIASPCAIEGYEQHRFLLVSTCLGASWLAAHIFQCPQVSLPTARSMA